MLILKVRLPRNKSFHRPRGSEEEVQPEGDLPVIEVAVDDILVGGVVLIGELDEVPTLLAKTDSTIEEVSVGAVRYAGSVGKLLG